MAQGERIGIVSRPQDLLATHFREHVLARGVETLAISFHGLTVGLPIAFDGDVWLVGGEDLASLRGMFIRQYPAATQRPADLEGTKSALTVWDEAVESLERTELIESCLFDLERSGVRIVNPPHSTAAFDKKAFQLASFQRAGLRIPRTLITNFPEAARLFEKDVGTMIAKPIGGGSEARIVDAAAHQHLEGIRERAAIFQERVIGTDIRVTIVAGKIISAVEIPSTTLDYRSGEDYRAGRQHYPAHALSAAGADLALKAASICHHILSGVDLKHTPKGDYVLIEANASPLYLDIENKTGAPITDAIVDWMLSR